MNTFNVEELKPDTFFTANLILDKTFLLLTTSTPVTEILKKALLDWDFKQVFTDGNINSNAGSINSGKTTSVDLDSQDDFTGENKNSSSMSDAIKKALSNAEQNDSDQDTSAADAKRLSIVQSVYNEYLNYINAVYTRYATHKELNLNDLSSTVKDLCIFIIENRRYDLRIPHSTDSQTKDFLG